MVLLVLGLVIWIGAHTFKRIAPEARARLGDAGRGLVALANVVAIVLMVIGYRAAAPEVLWTAPPAMHVVNNLAMFVALYLFVASNMNVAVRRFRHPQLSAVLVFAFAHLVVRGQFAALVLFGGLAAWAAVEMMLINRSEPDWQPGGEEVAIGREAFALLIAFLAFAFVGAAHAWIGPWPFAF